MTPEYLYVHAPFCARRCSYCDFAVTVARKPPVSAWAEAISAELALVAAARGWADPLRLRTLYLGGGTPSLLGEGGFGRLLDGVGERVVLEPGAEVTAEANPESFTPGLARDWVAAGVNRVSFGAQTFHGPTLRWMGRLHGPDGPGRAVRVARDAGVENIGLDLIFGLPERLGRDLGADIDAILALEPEHISVYGLTVEPTTPLGRWVREGRESAPDPDRYGDEYLDVARRISAAGYEHYEVSNFARPGRWSRHNSAYWRGSAYLGLGNGAHSFVGARRWWNQRDWNAYRQAVAEGRSPMAGEEAIGPAEARLESIWLGLRTREGLAAEALGTDQSARVAEWEARGWAERSDGRVRLTVQGWLLLDRLAVELDGVAA